MICFRARYIILLRSVPNRNVENLSCKIYVMRKHCTGRYNKYAVKSRKMKCTGIRGFISLKASSRIKNSTRNKISSVFEEIVAARRGAAFTIDRRKKKTLASSSNLYFIIHAILIGDIAGTLSRSISILDHLVFH